MSFNRVQYDKVRILHISIIELREIVKNSLKSKKREGDAFHHDFLLSLSITFNSFCPLAPSVGPSSLSFNTNKSCHTFLEEGSIKWLGAQINF